MEDVQLVCNICGDQVLKGERIAEHYRFNGCDHWYVTPQDPSLEGFFTVEDECATLV